MGGFRLRPEIISENDWHSVRVSFQKMNEVTLWRELDEIKITLSTVTANKAWNVAMLVSVEFQNSNYYWRQYFDSVERARRYLERQITKEGS